MFDIVMDLKCELIFRIRRVCAHAGRCPCILSNTREVNVSIRKAGLHVRDIHFIH